MRESLQRMGSLFYFLVFWIVPMSGSSSGTASVQSAGPVPDTALSMVFAGDLNLSDRFEQYTGANGEFAFTEWQKIGPVDAQMVNLENPVTFSSDSSDKEFVFRMHPRYLKMIKMAGISIVNCANNHLGDFGCAGIVETLFWLDSLGIRHTGAGRNSSEARKPVVISFHHKTVGILGYGGDGIHYAGHSAAGTMPCDESTIVHDVRALAGTVDLVVVNFHWGDENAVVPGGAQIRLAHAVIDAGADLIIGHHPHVLQGIEYYKKGVIAYSLGNFVFGGNAREINSETIVLKIEVEKSSWRCTTMPVMVVQWKPQPADSVKARRVLDLVAARSKILNQQMALHMRGVAYE
jgi:poly-gamma-glutamate synthesis protein (capsule biosynthesis protein)